MDSYRVEIGKVLQGTSEIKVGGTIKLTPEDAAPLLDLKVISRISEPDDADAEDKPPVKKKPLAAKTTESE